ALVGGILDLGDHILLSLFQDFNGIAIFGRVLGVLAALHQVLVDALHLHDLAGIHLVGAGLLNGKALLLAGVDVVNLYGEDAVVTVLVSDLDGPVALRARRLELPRNLGELHILLIGDVVVDVPFKDTDDDALGGVGNGVIGLGERARNIDAAADDRVEINLAFL